MKFLILLACFLSSCVALGDGGVPVSTVTVTQLRQRLEVIQRSATTLQTYYGTAVPPATEPPDAERAERFRRIAVDLGAVIAVAREVEAGGDEYTLVQALASLGRAVPGYLMQHDEQLVPLAIGIQTLIDLFLTGFPAAPPEAPPNPSPPAVAWTSPAF